MNILVTSVGRRVEIIKYFKKALNTVGGLVITTDCDKNAPALYVADDRVITPRIDDSTYIVKLLDICKVYNITAIVSLIDPELEILSLNKEKFANQGIQLILSPTEMIQYSFDKQETYNYLSNLDLPCVPTYSDGYKVQRLIESNELSLPIIAKPKKGSASIGIEIIDNLTQLQNVISRVEIDDLILQPFYKEKEYGIDVYIDMINGSLVDVFIKEKLYMRSGETDKSKSINNIKILDLIREFVSKTNFVGPIDIDCFEYKGEYFISEINPRFGGGYPHAYHAGCDFMEYIVKNIKGEVNPGFNSVTYNSGSVMMKYDSILMTNN